MNLRNSSDRQVIASGVLVAALAFLSGCSASTKPQVGAISFTDSNGNAQTAPASMSVGTTNSMDVVVSQDPVQFGANWSVACGSALPLGSPLPTGETEDESCGTFTPVHTASGPVPSYAASGCPSPTSADCYVTLYTAPAAVPKEGIVTLYASSTSDPAIWSSVTLTITGLQISVVLTPVPPATLAVSGTTSLKAVVSNDSASAGVKWTVTCGSSNACGSFASTQTASGVATAYTAPAAVPAGNAVTVVATSITDPTKSVSAKITIE
jgi:hypothetical protein